MFEKGDSPLFFPQSPDEEAAGGNRPDGGLRDFADFPVPVDDDASPPLAAQALRHIPTGKRGLSPLFFGRRGLTALHASNFGVF